MEKDDFLNIVLPGRGYYDNVLNEINELKRYYPFTSYTIPPTLSPSPVQIRTVAADYKLIKKTRALEQDFLGEYSKELEIIVPYSYRISGCIVYGGQWINKNILLYNDQHFYDRNSHGKYQFCVGVPESFIYMKNVILENIRTADKMLVAYELFQTGQTNKLELLAYSHGDKGQKEYKNERKKYKTK